MKRIILIVCVLVVSLASAGQKTAGFVLQTSSGSIEIVKFKTSASPRLQRGVGCSAFVMHKFHCFKKFLI